MGFSHHVGAAQRKRARGRSAIRGRQAAPTRRAAQRNAPGVTMSNIVVPQGQASKPYSYARMIDVINKSSEDSGVSVEVKKQCADGTYMPADEADLKTADFDMKLSQAINAVKDLPRERKLAFSREMRDAGNEA